MAQWYRAQVIIPHDSGLPEDQVVNTWHYMVAGSGNRATLATDFDAQLDAFYTAWVPAFGSTAMDWNAIVTKHYDFLDGQPRLPFYTGTISPGAPPSVNNDWPAEVAICLSFQGEVVSGVNVRRRRGRVYLGPWASATGDLPLLANAAADTIATGADSAFFASGTTQLAVYSPYTHHAVPVGENIKDYPAEVPDALPSAFTPAVKLWVDNAWDTQRRRGLKSTYRKSFLR